MLPRHTCEESMLLVLSIYAMKYWVGVRPRWPSPILKGDGMSEMIGFIGLGNMGQAMASSLLKAGYALTVYNRTLSKAGALTAKGAHLAHQPSEAVTKGGTVISMVADDQALHEIVMSQGFLERLGPGG